MSYALSPAQYERTINDLRAQLAAAESVALGFKVDSANVRMELGRMDAKLAAAEEKLRQGITKQHTDALDAALAACAEGYEAQLVRMREALRWYGTHHGRCKSSYKSWNLCTCGLDALLKEFK